MPSYPQVNLIKNVSAGGVGVGDQQYYGLCPDFSAVSLRMGKAPGPNTWIQLTAVAGLLSLGYLTLMSGGGTKVRIPIADHPDAG